MRTVYNDMIERPGFAEDNDLIEGFMDEVDHAIEGVGSWGLRLNDNNQLVDAGEVDFHVVEGLAVVYAGVLGVTYRIPYYGVTDTTNELPVLPTPTVRIGEEERGTFYDLVDRQVDPFRRVPILNT